MNKVTAAILANDTVAPDELRLIFRTGRSATYSAIKSKQVPSFLFGGSIHIPSEWVRAKLVERSAELECSQSPKW
jgi:hypothetical protein